MGKGAIFSVGMAAAAVIGTWQYLQTSNPELVNKLKSKDTAAEAVTNMYVPGASKAGGSKPDFSGLGASDAQKAVADKFVNKVMSASGKRLEKMGDISGIDMNASTSGVQSAGQGAQGDNKALEQARAGMLELKNENANLKARLAEIEKKYSELLLRNKRVALVAPEGDSELKKQLYEAKDRYFKLVHESKAQAEELAQLKRDFAEAFNNVVDAAAKSEPAIRKQALYYKEKCNKLQEQHKEVIMHYQVLIKELKAEVAALRSAGK